jgi:hypothetical protein
MSMLTTVAFAVGLFIGALAGILAMALSFLGSDAQTLYPSLPPPAPSPDNVDTEPVPWVDTYPTSPAPLEHRATPKGTP